METGVERRGRGGGKFEKVTFNDKMDRAVKNLLENNKVWGRGMQKAWGLGSVTLRYCG